MSAIEQRLEDALADLEGLLAEGMNLEQALAEASQANGIRAGVLQVRAFKRFGDLNEIKTRSDNSVRAAHRWIDIKTATHEYCEAFYGPEPRPAFEDFDLWMRRRLNIELTPDEWREANALREEQWNAWIFRDLRDLLERARTH